MKITQIKGNNMNLLKIGSQFNSGEYVYTLKSIVNKRGQKPVVVLELDGKIAGYTQAEVEYLIGI